jgi:hypothetical protein
MPVSQMWLESKEMYCPEAIQQSISHSAVTRCTCVEYVTAYSQVTKCVQNGELVRLALVGSILLHTVQAAKDMIVHCCSFCLL